MEGRRVFRRAIYSESYNIFFTRDLPGKIHRVREYLWRVSRCLEKHWITVSAGSEEKEQFCIIFLYYLFLAVLLRNQMIDQAFIFLTWLHESWMSFKAKWNTITSSKHTHTVAGHEKHTSQKTWWWAWYFKNNSCHSYYSLNLKTETGSALLTKGGWF